MQADLALEGGGVKGIGLVGAVTALVDAGYDFERVVGSSAGAIVGSLVAAGATTTQMREWLEDLDYRKLPDPGLLDRFGPPGKVLSLVFEKGVYEGEWLRAWVADRLSELGVETFGDLRRDDPDSSLPPSLRYRLVVTATDLSAGRLVRLPWDYPLYGLDPDEQSVAQAVRTSAAIPYFYEPVELTDSGGDTHYLVDGGLIANFPVSTFDRRDPVPARWPTIGVKLSARPTEDLPSRDIRGPISYLEAVVGAAVTAQDRVHLEDPCTLARTVFVDTSGVSPIDFGIDRATQQRLFTQGVSAAEEWLETWDWEAWERLCRRGVSSDT